MRDAFHHIRLAPRECARLAFRVAGVLYFPLTLPFGLKLAPWALTKLLRPVIAHLRSHGYVVMPYMDDFGISVEQPSPVTADEATAARAYAVTLFRRLGLHVHPTKGQATGTTRLEILGFVVDTVRQLLILPPERRRKLVGSAHSLLRAAAADRRWVRTRALQRFCGRAASAALAIPLARYRLRSLFTAMAAARGRSRLDTRALSDLVWWADLSAAVSIGRTLWERPTAVSLDTDASPSGWGAVRDELTPAQGFFSHATRAYHINRKELLPVIYAIESFPSVTGPGVVRVRTDSRVTMAVVNSLSSRSPRLMSEVHRLHALLRRRGLGIEATWLASLEKAHADRLSREPDSTGWVLSPAAFTTLSAAWGPFTVDRFASTLWAKLPRFNSARACPGTEAVNAYTQPWGGEINYCAPPFSQAAAAFRKCYLDRATAVLILPSWTAQAWWRRAVLRASASVALPAAAVVYTRGPWAASPTSPPWQMVALFLWRGGTPPTPRAGAGLPLLPSWPPSARPLRVPGRA